MKLCVLMVWRGTHADLQAYVNVRFGEPDRRGCRCNEAISSESSARECDHVADHFDSKLISNNVQHIVQ